MPDPRDHATDRNVLRIAAWEILYGDTPPRVAVNEAIELAKRYGDAQSSRFVNGVLDKLMQNAPRGGAGKRAVTGIPADAGEAGNS